MDNADDRNPEVENVLKSIEGIGALVSTIDGIKTGLEEQGWDSTQAQATARVTFDNIMKMRIAEIQSGVEQ